MRGTKLLTPVSLWYRLCQTRIHPLVSESSPTLTERRRRKRAPRTAEDKRIDELRDRLQFAAETAEIGYWFCDLPFDKLNWDSRVKEHFWLDPDAEVDIREFYRRLHPDDRERTREALERAIAEHSRYDIEYRTVSPEGRIKWIRAIGRTAYNLEGLPVRFDGISQDITAQKRMDAGLRENEKRLRVFADFLPSLAWMANADGWLFWYNRRWYEYTGTTPEEMEGWGWQSVHDPAMLPAVIERWTSSIRTGEPFAMVFPLRGADGIFRSFLTRAVPVHDDDGKLTAWLGTTTEVDELQQARDALRASEERIRVALKNLPVILYSTDRQLRYTWIQRAHKAYPPERILGRRDIDLDPEKFREVNQFKRSVLESGVAGRQEIVLVIDGKVEIYDYFAEPLRDADGNIVGLTVAAIDITNMRRAEEALRKAEKLAVVGRLASSIAHEINNPLESVVNALYLIRVCSDPVEREELVRMAEEELARVSHVVTHSLRFSRQSTAPTLHQLSTIADSALGLYQGRLRNTPIRLIRDFRPAQPLLCLEGELRQVFANLIGNAIDATAQGTICLRIREGHDPRSGVPCLRVTVADKGSGIDDGMRDRLFEPFATTKENVGTGLGLWVTAEILKRHHATIRVRSSRRAGNSGTVFAITFPRVTRQPLETMQF
jgi:two-component system, sporulation sensor kinase E